MADASGQCDLYVESYLLEIKALSKAKNKMEKMLTATRAQLDLQNAEHKRYVADTKRALEKQIEDAKKKSATERELTRTLREQLDVVAAERHASRRDAACFARPSCCDVDSQCRIVMVDSAVAAAPLVCIGSTQTTETDDLAAPRVARSAY